MSSSLGMRAGGFACEARWIDPEWPFAESLLTIPLGELADAGAPAAEPHRLPVTRELMHDLLECRARSLDREISACGFFAPDELPEETTQGTRLRIAEVLDGRAPLPADRTAFYDRLSFALLVGSVLAHGAFESIVRT